MRKFKVALLGASLIAGPQPARASTCMVGLRDACAAAARVICGVVAKGRPCLY